LQPKPNAPRLPFGYMTMILIALVPPLFRRTMQSPLAAWDREHANPAELSLLGRPEYMSNLLESKT
jgi:alkane 1-monooxygenase